jgi:branched-chain amino acid transport system permease protein
MKKPVVAILAVFAVLAVMPVLIPWSKVILTMVMSKGLAVLGVLVLLRAGQVSFGHAMFYATSAYTVTFITRGVQGVDLLTVVVAGVAASTLLGLLVGLFVVRYRYIFFSMLNLAISMVLYALLEKFYYITGGSDGLMLTRPEFFGRVMERAGFETCFYYLVLISSIMVAYGVHCFLKAPIGQALAAIKTNETRLEYLGISTRNVMLSGYVLSTALVGLGGAFSAISQGVITPEFAYWVRSGEFIFIAILGGAGNVLGAFAGSLIFEVVRMYFIVVAAGMWQMLLGIILLIIVMAAPDGIIGILSRKKRPVSKRKQAATTKEIA